MVVDTYITTYRYSLPLAGLVYLRDVFSLFFFFVLDFFVSLVRLRTRRNNTFVQLLIVVDPGGLCAVRKHLSKQQWTLSLKRNIEDFTKQSTAAAMQVGWTQSTVAYDVRPSLPVS